MTQTSTIPTRSDTFIVTAPPTDGTTVYNDATATQAAWGAENTVGNVCPDSITIKNWRVKLAVAPGAGKTTTLHYRVNGVDQLTVTIAGTNTTGNCGANTCTAVAGDILTISYTTTAGSASAGNMSYCWQCDGAGMYTFLANTGVRNLPANTTQYAPYNSVGNSLLNPGEQCIMPCAGTFRMLAASTDVDPGGSGQSLSATLQIGVWNGTTWGTVADTALTTAVNTGGTFGQDVVNSVHVNAGDLMQTRCTTSASCATVRYRISYRFDPDVPGECPWSYHISQAQNLTRYSWQVSIPDATESNRQQMMCACSVRKGWLYTYKNSDFTALDAGQTQRFTLRINAADAGSWDLTVTGTSFVAPAMYSGADIPYADDDLLDFKIITSATTTTCKGNYGLVFFVAPTGQTYSQLERGNNPTRGVLRGVNA